jgi:hypothetical protein
MADEPTTHALMLRDTVIELRHELEAVESGTDFDRGYAMGLSRALDVLYQQCLAFGLREDLGWMEPDTAKWLRKDG